MGDYYDVLAAFEFHDDGFQTDHDVAVRFAAAVAVVVFVIVACLEVFGIAVGYFLVGEAVADARVELVEGFPFQFVVAFGGGGEIARCLDGAFEGGGPDCQLAVVANRRGYLGVR